MKKTFNVILLWVFLISILIIVGQGFAIPPINDFMEIILRIVAVFSIQLLMCRIGKYKIVEAIPLIVATGLAFWGIWLFFTSPHWSHASVSGLTVDYILPAIVCLMVWITDLAIKRKVNS